MKLLKFIGTMAMVVLAWHFLKNNKNEQEAKKQGSLSRLVDGIKDEIKKPIDRIDDDIPEAAGGINS